MSGWVTGCGRLYRRMARAFPYEFRAVCGDGLEQLGEDVVPLVWQQQGIVGLIRLFADLALRLPCEYLSTWSSKVKELTMADDFFEGTWRRKARLRSGMCAIGPRRSRRICGSSRRKPVT